MLTTTPYSPWTSHRPMPNLIDKPVPFLILFQLFLKTQDVIETLEAG